MGGWFRLLYFCALLLGTTSVLGTRLHDAETISKLGTSSEPGLLDGDPQAPGHVPAPRELQSVDAAVRPSIHIARLTTESLPNHARVADVSSPSLVSMPHPRVPILTVVVYTIFMSLATGLGALPFFFCKSLTAKWAALANAVASGVMLACSFDLVHEGQPYGPGLVIIGVVLGALFIKASQEWLSQFEEVSFDSLQGADARKALLIVGVMAAHAIGEGSGVGVSFAGEKGWTQGTLVTLAIGLHNIPEGLAVATVMASRGTSPWKTLVWTVFTALPQPLLAIPSYIFVDTFTSLLPIAMGFAAGCMVWIVFAELMPEALEAIEPSKAATAATLSAAWLEGMRMMVGSLEDSAAVKEDPVAITTTDLRHLLGLLPAWMACITVAAAAAGCLGRPTRLGLGLGVQALMAGGGAVQLLLRCGSLLGAAKLVGAAGAGAAAWTLLARIAVQQLQGTGAAIECDGYNHKRDEDVEESCSEDAVTDALHDDGHGCVRRAAYSNSKPLPHLAHANGGYVSPPHAHVVLQLKDMEEFLPLSKWELAEGGGDVGFGGGVLAAQLPLALAAGLALAASNVPRGLGWAEDVGRKGGDTASMQLPLVLLGGLVGLACAALCPGPNWKPAAFTAAAVGLIQPLAALLHIMTPHGRAAAQHEWLLLQQAAACGALAASCLGLRRLAASCPRPQLRRALSLGVYLGLLVMGAGLLCCRLTPYCLHSLAFA